MPFRVAHLGERVGLVGQDRRQAGKDRSPGKRRAAFIDASRGTQAVLTKKPDPYVV